MNASLKLVARATTCSWGGGSCKAECVPGRKCCAAHGAKHRADTNARVAARKAAGLCGCGRTPIAGNSVCQVCRDRNRDAYRQRRADGFCTACTKGAVAVAAGRCLPCWFKNKAQDTLGSRGATTQPIAEGLAYLWEQQRGLCALTGEPLVPGDTASLDHKIPLSRGGTHALSNLQWVKLTINMAKRNQTTEEFLDMCRRVVEHEKGL